MWLYNTVVGNFNYFNLDAYEFEKFCKDLMKKKLKKEFKRFGPGKDDGIDLVSLDSEVICQCKRYENKSNLVTACKNELINVKKMDPKHYYFLTTASLNKTATCAIYDIFHDYMDDLSFVISASDLDDFLNEEENIDVLKKNHKLWLTSASVLSMFTDRYTDAVSQSVLLDMKEEARFFVETKAYSEAIRIIRESSYILLVGHPGTGKTLTSEMLIRYLLTSDENYKLTSVANGDLTELIKSIGQNDEKEIIYLDDFLGQTSLMIDDDRIKNLKVLFDNVRLRKNKKVILNSRITILNKAEKEKAGFLKLINDINLQKCYVDTDDLSRVDKARILYNHLYFNKVSQKDYETIKKEKRYNAIIDHPNFNARIIDICALRFKRDASMDNFFEYLLKALNNPEDVWRSEFEKIEPYERILMYQLYTLGNSLVPLNILEESVSNYLHLTNYYQVDNYNFKDSIGRLGKSLIGVIPIDGTMYVSVLKPSINDYIEHFLRNNAPALKLITENATYIEQIEKIVKVFTDDDIEQIQIRNFFDLKAYSNLTYEKDMAAVAVRKKLEFILKYSYKSPEVNTAIMSFFDFKNCGRLLVKIILDEDLRKYYGFECILNDAGLMGSIIEYSDYDDLFCLMKYYSENGFDLQFVQEQLKSGLLKWTDSQLCSKEDDYTLTMIADADPSEKYSIDKKYNDAFVSRVEEEVVCNLSDELEEIIDSLNNYGYDCSFLKEIDLFQTVDDGQIQYYIEQDYDDYMHDYEDYGKEFLEMEHDYEITVDDVFCQKYNIE